MSVTDNRTVEGTDGAHLLEAAAKAFEHIGVQLAVVFDGWKDNGVPDEELACCAYLVAFTGWWSGNLQAAADMANGRVDTPVQP